MRTSRRQSIVRGVVAALVLLSTLGTLTAAGTRPAAAAAPAARVHAFGGLPSFPELTVANKPVVGIAPLPSGTGYWLVATDGGIFGYGGAPFYGSTGATRLNRPVIGMASTPTGGGYWLVAGDGGIFNYGDAPFFGSTGGITLNKPIVGMAPTPSGKGYWLVAADGGVFNYGDAPFHGSTGGMALNKPVVGMAATASGSGYWLVAADGGVFGFGDGFGYGAVPGTGTNVGDVSAMARSAGGNGYLVVRRSGGVYAFGDAAYRGGTTVTANRAVVGIAAFGGGYWLVDAAVPRLSVGPPLPQGSGAGRRIVYCVHCQRVWFVDEEEVVVKSHLVSGRAYTPRPGTYAVFSKSRYSGSVSGSVTMEYMVRFAHGRTLAIGFHSIPRRHDGTPIQSEAQLGTYQSSGCVRQADRDALYTWNFAPVGTKVVVTA